LIVTDKLGYGLTGSELVRLVAGEQVAIVKRRIVRLAAPPPTDRNLVAACESIHGSPTAKGWVSRRREKIVDSYLRQLEAKGVLRSEKRKVLGLFAATDWFVVDRRRPGEVRRRLDEIVAGSGPAGLDERAFAGLAYAAGLGNRLYRGRAGKGQRQRLKQIARPRRAGLRFRQHGHEVREPTLTATSAAVDASRGAAIDAAVETTIDQAVEAAVNAAIHAAIDAGHSGGHDGGGHGGGH
jgi:hypothetical protein